MKLTWKQIIPTRPYAKGRPRFNRKTGVTYTPKETREYEKLLASFYNGPKFSEGPISVKLVFDIEKISISIKQLAVDEPTKLTGDIDNYAKAILDALNGVAFSDDKQIVSLELEKK